MPSWPTRRASSCLSQPLRNRMMRVVQQLPIRPEHRHCTLQHGVVLGHRRGQRDVVGRRNHHSACGDLGRSEPNDRKPRLGVSLTATATALQAKETCGSSSIQAAEPRNNGRCRQPAVRVMWFKRRRGLRALDVGLPDATAPSAKYELQQHCFGKGEEVGAFATNRPDRTHVQHPMPSRTISPKPRHPHEKPVRNSLKRRARPVSR